MSHPLAPCASLPFLFLYVCRVVLARQCVLWSPEAAGRKLLLWNRRKRRIRSIPVDLRCTLIKGEPVRGAPLTVRLGQVCTAREGPARLSLTWEHFLSYLSNCFPTQPPTVGNGADFSGYPPRSASSFLLFNSYVVQIATCCHAPHVPQGTLSSL